MSCAAREYLRTCQSRELTAMAANLDYDENGWRELDNLVKNDKDEVEYTLRAAKAVAAAGYTFKDLVRDEFKNSAERIRTAKALIIFNQALNGEVSKESLANFVASVLNLPTSHVEADFGSLDSSKLSSGLSPEEIRAKFGLR